MTVLLWLKCIFVWFNEVTGRTLAGGKKAVVSSISRATPAGTSIGGLPDMRRNRGHI